MARHVLIVDDDAQIAFLLGMLLQREGYEVASAQSGREALEQVEQETPSVIILDLHMPDMPGSEIIERLEQIPGLADVPIIVATGDTGADTPKGAMMKLTKPFNISELLAALEDATDPNN